MKNSIRSFNFAFTAITAFLISSGALAAPLNPAVRTIYLDPNHNFSVASSVAYHPGFDQYYTSDTGNSSYPGFVFSNLGGAAVQTLTPLGIDARSWFYNANTAQLELSSYNACCTGVGIVAPTVDAGGLLTGAHPVVLAAPVSGLPSSQSAPSYNPTLDVLYARVSGDNVNVVKRSDGTLDSTIVLDFASAGGLSASGEVVVYISEENALGVLDTNADDLVVFDLSGAYLGRVNLDIDVTSASSRPGYTNGQLFVFDASRSGWQGYQVSDGVILPELESNPIPTLSSWSILMGILLLTFVGWRQLRRQS